MAEREYIKGEELLLNGRVTHVAYTKGEVDNIELDVMGYRVVVDHLDLEDLRTEADFISEHDRAVINAAEVWAGMFSRPWSGVAVEGEPVMMGQPWERDLYDAVQTKLDAEKRNDFDEIERLCEIQHDAYEAAATKAGWETNKTSRKPWSEVPEANKVTMRAAVRALVAAINEANLLKEEA